MRSLDSLSLAGHVLVGAGKLLDQLGPDRFYLLTEVLKVEGVLCQASCGFPETEIIIIPFYFLITIVL